jgi:hypothetical protein
MSRVPRRQAQVLILHRGPNQVRSMHQAEQAVHSSRARPGWFRGTTDQDAIAAFVPSHFATQNQMGASFANIVTDMMGREASFAMMPMPQGIASTYTLPGVAAVPPSHC